MKKTGIYLSLVMAAVLLLAAAPVKDNPNKKFIELSQIDYTVRPQDDFFQYANGAWLDSIEIPATESSWGSFSILAEKSAHDLNSILREFEGGEVYAKGSVEQLVADLYRSGMDSLQVEKLGISPLQKDLDIIAGLQKSEDILPEIAREIRTGRMPLAYGMFPTHILSFYVYQDAKNSESVVAQFDQGDLGLPNCEYYTRLDSGSIELRDQYHEYVREIFISLGSDPETAIDQARNVLYIESQLASGMKTPVELRDPIANYNKFAVSQLAEMMPKFGWEGFIANLGIETDTVLMGQPDYYKKLESLIYGLPLEYWKEMLTFWLVRNNAGALPYEYLEDQFDFYGRTMRGQQEMKPRWKRISGNVNAGLGDAMGQLYVKKFFPPEAKERMDKLVDNLLLSYEERITASSWMSAITKDKALIKLHTISRKIGYPDKWDDYEGVEINPDTYLANLMSIRTYGYTKMISKLGQPVDRDIWLMTPSTINAYYNPSNNEIVFPAGILQSPFFDMDADDAVNYGAIGMVIAHEVTHGFDDNGRLYDEKGNLKNWWTAGDSANYEEVTAAIIEQFSHYKVLDTLFLNGELTQGENIADLGGLVIAYNAFKKTKQGQSGKLIDGLTPDQRFFLSYAKVWMIKTTTESLREQVLTDPHPPAKFRVNGPLMNMPEFYQAFGVKSGDKLYKPEEDRIVIW
ncbi:MAG: M13 family metallopeptidase [Bacteroidales bacterium]|nr:M13 family metallopeptidase [Bacteroidales bacterium]